MTNKCLDALTKRAKKLLPGGVNSPVRNMKSVGQAHPFFAKKACHNKIYHMDNTAFIDWCQTWGAMILGHQNAQVMKKIQYKLLDGTHFGCSTEEEVLFAEMLIKHVPSFEQIRCVSSGTEATMSAIRLARAYTQRDLIIKFEGCYHGHADFFLVSAGSGVSEIPQASSEGIPKAILKDILCLAYNDIHALDQAFQKYGDKIAAVIVEPVCANMSVILPQNNFLNILRSLTHQYGSVLIFDEVITGFRLSLGGAQQRFNITPDLSCFGKIVGGGFNIGVFGGQKKIMQQLAPCGHVYQAGTLSGHPLAMVAGLETIKILQSPLFYEQLENFSQKAITLLKTSAKDSPYPIKIQSIGSLFSISFSEKDILSCFQDIQNADHKLFSQFHQYTFKNNHFLSPSGYETQFIGKTHTQNDVEELATLIKNFRLS